MRGQHKAMPTKHFSLGHGKVPYLVNTGSWAPITLILAIRRNNVEPTRTTDLTIDPCNHWGIFVSPCKIRIRIAHKSLNNA